MNTEPVTSASNLSAPSDSWQQAPEFARKIAALNREAFASLMPAYVDVGGSRPLQDIVAEGQRRYKAARGHDISRRGLLKLLDENAKRDGGHNDWQRIESYLPKFKLPPVRKAVAAPGLDLQPLRDRLHFADPLRPSLSEQQNALSYSFELAGPAGATVETAAAAQRHAVRKSILDCLWSVAPSLAKSPKALRCRWDRLYRRWIKGGRKPSAIHDKRQDKAAGSHLARFKIDIDALVTEAWLHDGRIALAYRKLRRAGKLSPAFMARYTFDVRRHKSYFARSIIREVKARLTGTLEHRRSQWAVERGKPPIQRDWSMVQPGDIFAADDVTWNNQFKFINDDGQEDVTRGECIVFIDCRSLYILGWVFVTGHYNGEVIRRGFHHVERTHGLPRLAVLLEKSIFASRLITGERGHSFFGWDEFEMGLRERGLSVELRNVTTPGAKVIESIFNPMQQEGRPERGFVGFNARDYGQEHQFQLAARIKAGKGDPRNELPWLHEWNGTLSQIAERYNNEPQNGRLLQGASPAEMFTAGIRARPLRRLSDNELFLLSTHRVKTKVTAKGVALRIRGKLRFYSNEELGKFRGRQVLAWFNTHAPELLTVTSLDRKEIITVKHEFVPAYGATDEQLSAAFKRRNGMAKDAKLEVDRIRHPLRHSITHDNRLDADTQTLGAHIRQSSERHQAEQKEQSRLEARAIREAERMGLSLPAGGVANPSRQLEGLKLLQESQEELAREQQEKESHE